MGVPNSCLPTFNPSVLMSRLPRKGSASCSVLGAPLQEGSVPGEGMNRGRRVGT